MPGGRVLSRSRPSTPSAMNRSCQRHTQVLDLPVAAMTPTVPTSSAVSRMIRARQTCFCGDPRAATTASSRALSKAVTLMLIPLRIPHRRTPSQHVEPSAGLVRPDQSTSARRPLTTAHQTLLSPYGTYGLSFAPRTERLPPDESRMSRKIGTAATRACPLQNLLSSLGRGRCRPIFDHRRSVPLWRRLDVAWCGGEPGILTRSWLMRAPPRNRNTAEASYDAGAGLQPSDYQLLVELDFPALYLIDGELLTQQTRTADRLPEHRPTHRKKLDASS